MPNTKAVGVAFSDPQFESAVVTGTATVQDVVVNGSMTLSMTDITVDNATVTVDASVGGDLTVDGDVTGANLISSGTAAVSNGVAGLYFLTTAVEANVTTTSAPEGSIATTTNATGAGELFVSDGSKWQTPVVPSP